MSGGASGGASGGRGGEPGGNAGGEWREEPGGDMRPLRFDLSTMVRRSVATLYSHLVTRPTGQALRLGIESQIGEVSGPCLSVLDFRQVSILDYSCADEAVAKLLQRYLRKDGPADVYFIARGVGARHLETIHAVLERHDLGLVAEVEETGMQLLGPLSPRLRALWERLELRGTGTAPEFAEEIGEPAEIVTSMLDGLARRRLVLRRPGEPVCFLSLSSLLAAED